MRNHNYEKIPIGQRYPSEIKTEQSRNNSVSRGDEMAQTEESAG